MLTAVILCHTHITEMLWANKKNKKKKDAALLLWLWDARVSTLESKPLCFLLKHARRNGQFLWWKTFCKHVQVSISLSVSLARVLSLELDTGQAGETDLGWSYFNIFIRMVAKVTLRGEVQRCKKPEKELLLTSYLLSMCLGLIKKYLVMLVWRLKWVNT